VFVKSQDATGYLEKALNDLREDVVALAQEQIAT
jgi:hypothetical protein